MSSNALDGTVECNKFLCFNLLDIDRAKKDKMVGSNPFGMKQESR